jgi:hypothetical protein
MGMSRGRVRSTVRTWRRTAFVGVAVSGAVLVTAAVSPGTSAAQATSFNNGIGSAVASSLRVDPKYGALSFGIGVAEALAGHQNTVGTAESRTANLGVIGVTLAAEACDGGDPTLPAESQPISLRIDSTQPGADAGESNTDHLIPGVQRTVRATQAPFAEASTVFPGVDIPGILSIGPITARTTSGVFGDYREATSTVTIAHVRLLGGLIELSGLQWEAIHRTGSIEEAIGGFTVAAAKGPLQIPLPTDSVVNLLDALNPILNPLGIEIRLPTFHVDSTANSTLSNVDPLAIAIVPAALRDTLVGGLYDAIKGAKQNLTNALIEADCGNATYVTILDLVLNALGPGGEMSIDLGGVQATTSAINAFQSGATTPTTRPSTTATTAANRTTATTRATTPTTRVTTPTTAPPATTATTTPTETIDDAVDTADVSGERGGPLLAVGAAGLLLLLATAEGDRRKMRRAQREIPLEG